MNFMENESAQKLRGGYYTPADLAGFIARWVGEKNPKDILEPSCGDGVFFAALSSCPGTTESNIMAFELDSEEAQSASRRAKELGLSAKIRASDFLAWSLYQLAPIGDRFDAVVGNPPFIRYQYLPTEFQVRAQEVFRLLDCKFTKHTNAWVPFILASFACCIPGADSEWLFPRRSSMSLMLNRYVRI